MRVMGTRRFLWILAAILLPIILLLPWRASSAVVQDAGLFNSPLLTPPAPSPTPLPSTEAQLALDYVAKQYGIPVEQLAILNEHNREYAELGRAFRAFTLLDLANDRFFNLLVDLKDHTVVENVSAIQQAEEDAQHQTPKERAAG